MRGVPWWGVISSAAAPVLLIGGWTVAAGLQPRFDPVADTVSALAAIGATDRWVMTLTFLLVGACYIVTALALKPARVPGRLILIGGAAAGMLVAASPEHAGGSGSVPHFAWACLDFAGLTVWPAAAAKRGPAVPWALRPMAAAAAVTALFVVLAWFGAELILGAGQVGLAERVMGGAQAAWPLAVVVSCAARRQVPLPRNRGGSRAGQSNISQDRRAGAEHRTHHHLGHGVVLQRHPGPAEQRDERIAAQHQRSEKQRQDRH
jgi:hypothetical membrane protein